MLWIVLINIFRPAGSAGGPAVWIIVNVCQPGRGRARTQNLDFPAVDVPWRAINRLLARGCSLRERQIVALVFIQSHLNTSQAGIPQFLNSIAWVGLRASVVIAHDSVNTAVLARSPVLFAPVDAVVLAIVVLERLSENRFAWFLCNLSS